MNGAAGGVNGGAGMASGFSAGFGRRFAALIYDSFLLAAVLMIYTYVPVAITNHAILAENSGAWAYVYQGGIVALIAAYYVLNWVRSGQTLGMRAWRLRAVNDRGRRMSTPSAALRLVCGLLAWPPCALGVLWLYVDPDHLALHDRLSKTRVLHVVSNP